MATIVIDNLEADRELDASAMRHICGGFLEKYGMSFPQGPVPEMASPLDGVGFFSDQPAVSGPVFLAAPASAPAPAATAAPQPMVTGFRESGPTQSKSNMIYRY